MQTNKKRNKIKVISKNINKYSPLFMTFKIGLKNCLSLMKVSILNRKNSLKMRRNLKFNRLLTNKF